jgi:hypothetical protein
MHMRSPHLVVPHFKGIVNEPDPAYEALLTGRQESGKALTEIEAHRLWEKCSSIELVQDVRRALVAMAHAAHQKEAVGGNPQLFSPEGCVHRVGSRVLRGAQLFGEMWKGDLVPEEIRSKVGSPVLEFHSDCTSREVNRVLANLDAKGLAEVITDSYHVERSQTLYDQRKGADQTVEVASPEDYTEQLIDSPYLPQGFRDLLCFGSLMVRNRLVKEGILQKEANEEQKYRLISLLGRRVEETLAGLLRSDRRILKQLFPEGVPQGALDGLPART